jgi:PAS domain S-box-containing protein
LRSRQIAPIAVVLGLAVAGFVIARVLAVHGAHRDAERQAEVAAARIRGRITQAVSLTESLRRFMVNSGGTGVTAAQFSSNAFWWLSPADLSAAAWVEPVPPAGRAAYQRQIGQPIVSPDAQHSVVPTRSRSSYLPATLVSGFPPMSVAGIDLSGEPGMAATVRRATRANRVSATGREGAVAGTRGLFLVAPAPNLINEVLHPGYVVLFVPGQTLLTATRTPGVRLVLGAATVATAHHGQTVGMPFRQAGQRFTVVVPQRSPQGTAEALPWIILGVGLVLAGFAGALGLNAGRRARAQAEADRIFNLSSDLIAVADFNGRFTRVNPAFERTLGYSSEELRSRPYVEFVHPDDRSQTLRAAEELAHGREVIEFQNRFLRDDGSMRWLEWSARSVPGEAAIYAAARDVTERQQLDEQQAESREALSQLADEQAALRRVATLVAEGASPGAVLDAVAGEMEALLDADQVALNRFEPGEEILALAHRGVGVPRVPVGSHVSIEGDSATARVRRTGRPARMEDYEGAGGAIAEGARATGLRSSVAVPIAAEGREMWGVITASWKRKEPPAADTEERMFRFAQLLATAIANAEARAEVERLADEQAALRRVATGVARGGPPDDVFAATVAELHAVVAADYTALMRYETDGSGVLLAALGESVFDVGSRVPLIGDSATAQVRRSGRTSRIDDFDHASGPVAEDLRASGLRSGVAAPIFVEGRLWGAMASGWTAGPPPRDAETRVAQFTDLVGTAIANAESRAELLASRARIVTTADQIRRRIERDLHDGAQQRLVTMTMKLRALEGATASQDEGLTREVAEIAAGLDDVLDELRETARGLHPVILSRGGLEPALKALGRRSPVPVELDVRAQARLPESVEVAAYYVVAEALTNAAKHAAASFVRVEAEVIDGDLRVSVHDDGVGGANPARGSGLLGLNDRVEALGGKLTLHSPPAGGTTLQIDLPLSE